MGALVLLLGGCGPRTNETLIKVNITSDLSVPDQLGEVAVEVRDHASEGAPWLKRSIAVRGPGPLVAAVGIVPEGTPTAREIEVRATAVPSAVTQTAVAAFVPHQPIELDLELAASCLGRGCPPGQTCRRGACQDAHAVTRPLDADAGGLPRDGAGPEGGSPDGGPSDGTPLEGMWTSLAPAVATGTNFTSVWVNGAGEVWVAGVLGTAGVIWRRDGTVWTQTPVTALPLYGIWSSGTGQAWAVGNLGTLLRWDGSAWAPVAPSPTGNNLNGIWGSGPDDVWAVGAEGTILHRDARGWAAVDSGGKGQLLKVSGSGPNDVWVVGADTVLRRMGGAFISIPPQFPAALPYGAVWPGASTTWVFAETALAYSAGRWQRTTLPGIALVLGAWGRSDSDLWAMGQDSLERNPPPRPAVAHWDGVAWSAVQTPAVAPLQAVHGTAGAIWTVGDRGQVLRFGP
jgi:hypothetical protein